MKILVTGSSGFIGKNLLVELKNRDHEDVFCCDANTKTAELDAYAAQCEFVFHLAGVNRPQHESDYMAGNAGFTAELLSLLKKHGNSAPILMTSSIQAELDNAYGQSKRAGEELLIAHQAELGAKALIYRLPNVFGKWCRPNYNSVIATFCHNLARDLPIQINNRESLLRLVYIDDVVDEFICALEGNEHKVDQYCGITEEYLIPLGEVADLLSRFKQSREDKMIPNMQNKFEKKLYSTYLSYLPEDHFSYPLKMNCDARGSFTEFIKTSERGQVSVNVSKPGVTKGNHWHHTKNEKFLVVSGEGIVRFRRLDAAEVIEYRVSGEKLEVIDIPVGYTHSIVNSGKTDLVTVMWANEAFDPEKPDTYYLEV